MQIPRIMLAGTHSGVGKTTLTTAMLAALTRKGYRVQPYKVGPDYIDPGYHKLATGRSSRNLDPWMLGEEGVKEIFARSAVTGDLSVIEGVMGLYDGSSPINDFGSSAHVAKLIKTPVILVMDVKSMARSAAALALGFLNLDPQVPIAGFLLNKVSGPSHYNLVKKAIESVCNIPIVGYMPRNKEVEMPERHLGLVPTVENAGLGGALEAMVGDLAKTVDLDLLIDIAYKAEPLEANYGGVIFPNQGLSTPKVKIAYALDEAFNFYYQESLDLLEAYGAQLVPFSPLRDKELPQGIGGIYIGGGFPEMFLEGLSSNKTMVEAIQRAHGQGMPIYAECGGLMYLSKGIVDFEGNLYPMVGIVAGQCKMGQRLAAMGYVTGKALQDNVLVSQGETYRGHEFHYSTIETEEGFPWALELTKNRDGSSKPEGYAQGNLLASYVHLHFGSNPKLAKNFVIKCHSHLR